MKCSILPPPDATATQTTDAPPACPQHLAQLPGGSWHLWRCVGLRASGFSIAPILTLGAPACVAAADKLIDAERAAEQAQQRLLEAMLEAWNTAAAELRPQMDRSIRLIRSGRRPEPLPGFEQHVADWIVLVEHVKQARACFQQTHHAAIQQGTRAIYAIASDARFQEAVIWQNRSAYQTGICTLLQKQPAEAGRSSKQRQREELVASYAQRYCVKNDTIGFFGPLGWAQLVSCGSTITVVPGPNLIAKRTVYFESWCIQQLAATIAKDKTIRPWIAPRRTPFVALEGALVWMPFRKPFRLTAGQAAVLHLCDGTRAARAIALAVIAVPSNGLRSEDDVYRMLEFLDRMGLITWQIAVPIAPNAEQALRRTIAEIGDPRLRETAAAALAELEEGRSAVGRAANQPALLHQAMEDLEHTFTRLTTSRATRLAGQTYAGRTLIYEDCRRDLAVDLGPVLLETMGPPLSLLLASARWLTFQVALAYRRLFQEIYADLARKSGTATVDAVAFWYRLQSYLSAESDQCLVPAIVEQLQDRWMRILKLPLAQRRVSYTTGQLTEAVQETFDAPSPGWRSARYHSPDIMIDASSIDAIQRDDYQLVLGEIHAGGNTLAAALFLEQHPALHEVIIALESDLGTQRIVPVPPAQMQGLTTRTQLMLVSPADYRMELTLDPSVFPTPAQSLPIGSLVVEQSPDGLKVHTRDRRLTFDIIDVFSEALSALTIGCFRMLPPAAHLPRITFDRLVVNREQWQVAAAALAFAHAAEESERFLAARRWAQALCLPRFVFVKTPIERKPSYVDLESPIYVDILAKIARRTAAHDPAMRIAITEMLPTPDHTWLPDHQGANYTCEFRMVAVDERWPDL